MRFICLLAFLISGPFAHSQQPDWKNLLDQNGGHRVRFGVLLEDPTPYEQNSSHIFPPASNAKLFVAAAALHFLGENFRYTTRLNWEEINSNTIQNLELVGSGDPSWGLAEIGENLNSRVNAIARALRAKGVQKIQGSVTLSASDPRWDQLEISEGWQPQDPATCSGGLAQSFNLDINCAFLDILSPTQARWQSPGLEMPVTLNIRAGNSTNLEVNATDFRLTINGTWKAGSAPVSFYLPVWDTKSWVQKLFVQALKNQGIQFLPADSRRGVKKELEFYSPPLSELLKPFLKNSINMLGDAFLKSIALQGDRSLLQGGLHNLHRFLGEHRIFGLFHDGSGLSRASQVTPQSLLALLEHIKTQPYFSTIWGALPIAGVDGTLSKRMKNSPAAGRLRAKTGTLNGVFNLSGYVPEGADFVPFVILATGNPSLKNTARDAQDRVGAKLAEFLSSSAEPVFTPYPQIFRAGGVEEQ